MLHKRSKCTHQVVRCLMCAAYFDCVWAKTVYSSIPVWWLVGAQPCSWQVGHLGNDRLTAPFATLCSYAGSSGVVRWGLSEPRSSTGLILLQECNGMSLSVALFQVFSWIKFCCCECMLNVMFCHFLHHETLSDTVVPLTVLCLVWLSSGLILLPLETEEQSSG